jgi:anti-sigma factor RsiW
MNQSPVTEADLHAYVDGFLSEARQAEIADYLAARSEELERINAYREQKRALRALFSPVLHEPVPARIASAMQHRTDRYGKYAAALLIALAGGAGGWMLHGASQTSNLLAKFSGTHADGAMKVSAMAHQAAMAHLVYTPDARRPVEIGADQEEQLVKWLTKRTGADMHPPKLGTLGYELIGGRLVPGDSGTPAAQFMYQDAGGQRLTLYVSTDQAQNKDTGFRFAQQGKVNVFYWIDGKFGYALSAGIDKGELTRIAYAVYDQLDTRAQ